MQERERDEVEKERQRGKMRIFLLAPLLVTGEREIVRERDIEG